MEKAATATRRLTIPEAVATRPPDERVSDSTLRRAIREGRLPATRILNRYTISEGDLRRFLRNEEPKAAAAR
jgi:excisionase family DNA binding protein